VANVAAADDDNVGADVEEVTVAALEAGGADVEDATVAEGWGEYSRNT